MNEIPTLKQYCFQYLLRNHEKIPKKVSQIYEISDIREEFISMAKRKNLVDDQFFSIFGEIFILSNSNISNTPTTASSALSNNSNSNSNTPTNNIVNNNNNNNTNTNTTVDSESSGGGGVGNENNSNNNSNQNNIQNNHCTNIDIQTIKSIDLSGLSRITDISIQILHRYTNLESLNLSFCTGISNDFIRPLSSKASHINSLNLYFTNTNDNTLHAIANAYPNLKSLLIGGCSSVTEAGLKHLLKCPQLTHLDISHCKKLNNNNALKVISFPNLTYLNASWCFELASGDNCFHKIAKACPKLSTLMIATSNINESQLTKVLSEAKKLTTLDISYCHLALTPESKVYKYLGNIQNLNLSGCQFKEPVLKKVLESTPFLEELDLSHQDSLSWSLVDSIIKDPQIHKHLRILNFSSSKFDKFDQEAIMDIPSLTVFLPSLSN
ncbi:hypothetical protein CYY_009017 [Polysphondylium violaceum]|uniref:F-box/LRR-repeat protein 15-like leucin rich repeat domain-containing protein n=1 Tax=Polysphondylium violaceum TaxID=133409 RepID=A0A8J4PM79_9MYCE|nr:hypothetical protein CYY_009017 [Polysphondylium violaceum]